MFQYSCRRPVKNDTNDTIYRAAERSVNTQMAANAQTRSPVQWLWFVCHVSISPVSSGRLEETGAVEGDFVADVGQKLFHGLLELHHLVGLFLQSSLVVLV